MWLGPPLVVMNNFGGGDEALKLASVTFQNLFPAINVQTTRLSACQVGGGRWREGCSTRHAAQHSTVRVLLVR